MKELANQPEEIASIGDSQETNSKNDDDLNLREKTADFQTYSTSAESQTSDEVTVGKGNNQESDQTGVSLESAGDNEKQPSKPRRRRKSKTR